VGTITAETRRSPSSRTIRSRGMTSEATRSPLELFAAAVALVIPIAYTTGLDAVAWSARAAVLLVVVAVGLPLLVARAWGPRPTAARAALAFVAVGCASALFSQNSTVAVFGLYNQGTGVLFMASLAAAWAIGRSVRPAARSLVERAFIAGVLVNVGIAVLSSVVDLPPSIAVNMFDSGGRANALAGNPVHLAELAVVGLALIVPRFASAPLPWAVAVVAIAAATQLSGTRLALVVMLGIVLWSIRRTGMRTGIALGVLLVLGLAVGSAIARPGASATARTSVAGSDGSLSVRPETWWSARHAIAARPLLGIGPGQFRTATSPYRPVIVARAEGPDALFSDAHNLFVEYATTTGLLGLVALVAWLVAAIRQGRGWLLVGALGMLVVALFEPQSVVSTPLMFLALGVSAGDGVRLSTSSRRTARLVARGAFVVVGVLLAAIFLVAEFDLSQGQLDLRLSPVEQANRLLPAWPRTASLLAKVWLFKGIVANHDQLDYQKSRYWRLVALHRDDTDPALWDDLAELDASDGRSSAARVEFASALRLNPTSVRAMIGLANLARDSCDQAQEAYWHQRAVQVSPVGTVFPNSAPGGGATCGG
jgi:O-antigen ligase